MSEPSYRITTEYEVDARYPNIPWQARVVRLSDGEKITTRYSATEAGALAEAQSVIRALSSPIPAGSVYFADDDGSIPADQGAPVPAPESLRA